MLTKNLSDRLQELAASAEQLPPEVQDHLAEQLAIALDNAQWDAQLRDPANLEPLRELIDEARHGAKLPWPSPGEAGIEDRLDAEDLAVLEESDSE